MCEQFEELIRLDVQPFPVRFSIQCNREMYDLDIQLGGCFFV